MLNLRESETGSRGGKDPGTLASLQLSRRVGSLRLAAFQRDAGREGFGAVRMAALADKR